MESHVRVCFECCSIHSWLWVGEKNRSRFFPLWTDQDFMQGGPLPVVNGVITRLIGVITPFVTGDGAHLVVHVSQGFWNTGHRWCCQCQVQGKTRKKAVEGNGQRIPLEHATPPKTSMESKKKISFSKGVFSGSMLVFGGVCVLMMLLQRSFTCRVFIENPVITYSIHPWY